MGDTVQLVWGSDNSIKRTRKSKGKSKSGCNSCKQRRVKAVGVHGLLPGKTSCDEEQPMCKKCKIGSHNCIYPKVDTKDWQSNINTFTVSSSTEIPRFDVSIPLLSSTFEIPVHLDPLKHHELNGTTSISNGNSRHRVEDMELLRHFISDTSQHLDARLNEVWLKVVHLAFQHDYLMHALLAVSACHMQDKVGRGGQWQYLEAYHLDHALPLYRSMVSKAIPYSQYDAAIATSFLLVYQSFANLKWNPNHPAEDTCLSLAHGIFLVVGQHWNKVSIFRPSISPPLLLPPKLADHGPALDLLTMLRDPTLEDFATENEQMALYVTVIESLVPLFDLVQDWATQRPNPPLKHLEPAADMLIWFLRWLTACPLAFMKLVDMYDPRALCIMAYYWAVADTQTRKADRSYWWWKQRPLFMIFNTAQFLGVKWIKWMAWPQKMILATTAM